MARRPLGSVLGAALALAFVAGALLAGVALWLRPLAEGERLLRAGEWERALERFEAAEARFERLAPAKLALPAEHALSQANQLFLLHRLGRTDALIEKAAVAMPNAKNRFWAGCALFEKAVAEQEAEARIGWLSRAAEEFRGALELDPGDWDTKFNYELAQRLLAELRKQPKAPPSELLQLLRPKPKEGKPPARRTG